MRRSAPRGPADRPEGAGTAVAAGTDPPSGGAADGIDRTQPPSHGRWRLRNWRLLTKFTALLVIPLVLAVALGAARIGTSVTNAAELQNLRRQVELSQQVAGIAHELQRERHLAAALTATDSEADRAAVDSQIVETDALIGALRSTTVDQDDLTAEAAAAYVDVLAALDELPPLRDAVLTPNASGDIAIGRYGGRIGVLLRFDRLALAGANAALRGTASGVDALADAKEQVSVQHAVLVVAGLTGDLLAFQQDVLRESDTRFDAAIRQFTETSATSAGQLYFATVNGAEVIDRGRQLNAALNLPAGSAVSTVPADWDAASAETESLMRQVEDTLLAGLATQSATLSDQARTDAIRLGIIIAAVVLIALLFLLLVTRSVLGPLGTLRTAAFDIAQRQLPAVVERIRTSGGRGTDQVRPVPVDTREDIGQVARAFDAVHGEAVRLAGQQAELRTNVNDMFVNLSRRSQGLVERQLALIDQLEDGERDPDQLAALFRLDHLATRMRRNSENLLVLAGADLRRRSPQPMPVLDVLRAATSEIEQYRRVRVQPPPDAPVAGPVVSDLVHLIAELLDNATAYAPPESTVNLASVLGKDGSLLLEISDTGVGLTADQLAGINRRLAEPPEVDVSVSRQMGLFVVGRLAARHDITVRLTSSVVVAGVTAHVRVPDALIRGDGAAEPTPDAPAQTGRGAVVPKTTAPYAELFGPSVAGGAEDPLFGPHSPTTTPDAGTPIFEEVASAWFRDLRRVPVSVPGQHSAPAVEWASDADEGWLAARALEDVQDAGELTAVGLPKRRPGAQLVPGGAGSGSGRSAVGRDSPPPPRTRDADAVRGRLSSYQRGVREGRSRGAGVETEQNTGEEK